MLWLAVGLGGALGAIARYALSHQVYEWFGRGFAWGTLSVNIIGSFLMGLLVILLVNKWGASAELKAFLLVGFLGAFTTFSTFSFENVQYLQTGETSKALLNMVVSVLTCLLATWVGIRVAQQFLVE